MKCLLLLGSLSFASVMAFSSCLCHSPLLKIDHLGKTTKPCGTVGKGQKFPLPIRSSGAELCNQRIARSRDNLIRDWSFIGGSRVAVKPKVTKLVRYQKASPVYASWLSGLQLASTAFTLGTIAVLPFYTLMVLAPNSGLLSSIRKLFSSDMSLASAWIHLLVVDLFAARQVFQDGLENQIETRHSVSLCLFSCPIGIIAHIITKAMTKTTKENKHGL